MKAKHARAIRLGIIYARQNGPLIRDSAPAQSQSYFRSRYVWHGKILPDTLSGTAYTEYAIRRGWISGEG